MADALSQPTVFEDSLALRARGVRFRGVGNPYAFLDEIGIVPIKEFLFRGANIIDVADAINVPLTWLHKWIDNNNYGPDIEEASVISAEGYIYQGEKMLKTATNKFELDKAKYMLEHGRFMASKKNKKVYGNTQDVAAGPAGVTYIFNIEGGNAADAPRLAAKAIQEQVSDADVIDAEFNIQLPDNSILAPADTPMPMPTPEHIEPAAVLDTVDELGPMPKYLTHRPTPAEKAKFEPQEPVDKPRAVDRW